MNWLKVKTINTIYIPHHSDLPNIVASTANTAVAAPPKKNVFNPTPEPPKNIHSDVIIL